MADRHGRAGTGVSGERGSATDAANTEDAASDDADTEDGSGPLERVKNVASTAAEVVVDVVLEAI